MTGRTVTLGGGCFWGTEGFLRQLPGVLDTEVGYANSVVPSPSYELVCTGATEAAEAVRVAYDPAVIPLPLLLAAYFSSIDPCAVNRQGNDRGTQYRTGIWWDDEQDLPAVEQALRHLQFEVGAPLAVEAGPLQSFYPAEEHHQDYLEKHPSGYCHVDLTAAPRFVAAHARDFALAQDAARRRPVTETDDELAARIGDEAYRVTRRAGTERPHSSPLNDEWRRGVYVDAVSGEPLFLSSDKFDAGCGWPSFSRPIGDAVLTEAVDRQLWQPRIEVRSAGADSHLGHVFPDGPAETGGLRYCINGAALRFVPEEELEANGLGWLKLDGGTGR
ncbi:peptide-methionine (S)-S-oxide reductase MsrA [Olsenella sp. YH-ols2217]|uniref:Peptide methionine sulfoxide reductase MsrA n=1 Tax=Kribbibacterium absianum TaxID=3044210 RepID=A0ABT6ZHW8_9ACTN|nr:MULTISPECIES: peptide-methionine (S)-S-oxide reductase MsrA [unclassified Olsenella]MDJ1121157.1 peptide-methionine (S)-S-oxide reductase MsrA [Olsenella sp. YH-ols2216]MDJ1128648.1 peptide-methionine (S)-S-oxide reductase MsrA [Olsenella sp. YH-ols2217]